MPQRNIIKTLMSIHTNETEKPKKPHPVRMRLFEISNNEKRERIT